MTCVLNGIHCLLLGSCIHCMISPLSCLASYFNHSCTPTCHVIQYDHLLYVYTLCAVREGDPLSISYIDTEQNTSTRRLVTGAGARITAHRDVCIVHAYVHHVSCVVLLCCVTSRFYANVHAVHRIHPTHPAHMHTYTSHPSTTIASRVHVASIRMHDERIPCALEPRCSRALPACDCSHEVASTQMH